MQIFGKDVKPSAVCKRTAGRARKLAELFSKKVLWR